jgi:hypothetical protein
MRPVKLTPVVQKAIVNGIEMGLTYELAADYAGIGTRTLYRWMHLGREEFKQLDQGDNDIFLGSYGRLWHAIKLARAKCAASCLSRIHKAAHEGNWNAAAWILERRFEGFQREIPEIDININMGHDEQSIDALVAEYKEQPPELQAINGPVIDLDED